MSGEISRRAGLAAEEAVARLYGRHGGAVAAQRWRSQAGEIDLIVRDGAEVIFIEVKQSRSHGQAAAHLSTRQMTRIAASASVFLAGEPDGQDTPSRFDVALVDGLGRIEIIENAFAA
jgi:putative endonuclease